MNLRRIKWLTIGLSIPVALLLGTLHTTIGIPSINGSGLHWKNIERGSWTANGIDLSFDGVVQIALLEQALMESVDGISNDQVGNALPPILVQKIRSVEIDNLIVHRDDQSYDTRLQGTVYPNVALTNDWLSVGRMNEDWIVSGIVDSTSEFFQESIVNEWLPTSATLTFQFSVNIRDLSQPLDGSIQNMEWTHPILGTKIRIPSLTVFALRSDQGWMGQAKSLDDASVFDWLISTTDDDLTQSKWKIDYTLSLQDLTKWFSTGIPHAKPLGYWTGTITHKEASISGRELGFEGRLYALDRLETGYPVTYQPIHSDSTRLLGPNLPNWTPYAKLGWLAKAVIAGEDAPFFTHAGFNEEGLHRALNELLRERDNPIGGSSITQQVAKNLFTGNRATLDRKVEEMVYTLGLEAALSKEAILALYLNSIEFGDGIYGITEACNQYFLKKPEFLTVKEAVFLASILPNPRDGYRRAKLGRPPTRRMRAILQNLVDGRHITRREMNDAIQEPLRLLLPVE